MSIPISFENLIKNNVVESARIEYKKNLNPEVVLHTIDAFANDIDNWGGGYIVIGMNEDRSYFTVFLPINKDFLEDDTTPMTTPKLPSKNIMKLT